MNSSRRETTGVQEAWPCFGAFSPREDWPRPHVRVGFIGLGVGPSAKSSRPGKLALEFGTICFPFCSL